MGSGTCPRFGTRAHSRRRCARWPNPEAAASKRRLQCEVPGRALSGQAGLGEVELPHGVRLLILAPEASARGLVAPGAGRLQIHGSEDKILELGTDHQEVQVAGRVAALLTLAVPHGRPETAGMADLLDGPAASQGGWDSQGPQKVREIVGGKGLD